MEPQQNIGGISTIVKEGEGGKQGVDSLVEQSEQLLSRLQERAKQSYESNLKEQLHHSALLDLSRFSHSSIFTGTYYPWQVLPLIHTYIQAYFPNHYTHIHPSVSLIGTPYIAPNMVSIGANTIIQHGACVLGPAIIGAGCTVRSGAYIRQNVIIGDGCLIGSSSQIKNAVLFDGTQVAHFNYIGDSILGYRAHMAAGAIISNLKLDASQVVIKSGNLRTGLTKFGGVLGDRCEIGCNAVLNPGSIIGRDSVVYPLVNFRGYLQAKQICKLRQQHEVVERM